MIRSETFVIGYAQWPITVPNMNTLGHVQYCVNVVSKKKLFVAFPWVETSTGPGGFMICVFII